MIKRTFRTILSLGALLSAQAEAQPPAESFSISPGEYVLSVMLGESTFEDILKIERLDHGSPEDGFGNITHCVLHHSFSTKTAEGTFESPGLFSTTIKNSCLTEANDFFVFMIEINEGRGTEQYIFEFDSDPHGPTVLPSGAVYLNTAYPEFAAHREQMHEVGRFTAHRK